LHAAAFAFHIYATPLRRYLLPPLSLLPLHAFRGHTLLPRCQHNAPDVFATLLMPRHADTPLPLSDMLMLIDDATL